MLPLAGIKVLEIAQNLAGPFAAEILSHLGADVVKVERPGGDDARGWGPPFIDGDSGLFHAVNMEKRSIALDLTDPASVEWLKSYVTDIDVVVQNLRPGAVERLGLDAASLQAVNPRLIYCSLRAFGRDGPRRMEPGYEPMVQAFSGLMMVNGEDGGPPIRIGTQVLDVGSAMWAAIGILGALYRRVETGRGVVVDTSLFETALSWLRIHFARYQAGGSLPPRHPSGSAVLVVFQAFETKTGPVVVAAANDRLFAKLAQVVGRPEWAEDPRFANNAGRQEHRQEIIDTIEAVMKIESRGHWLDKFDAAGVPCSPINTMIEALDDPQAAATGMIQSVPGLDLPMMGLPLSFDGERPSIRGRAPALGQHSDEIKAEAARRKTDSGVS
jgi:crotonobetainyl-CoA:carnitine CoA-transferase CaiB-like acyl-CoA transferase